MPVSTLIYPTVGAAAGVSVFSGQGVGLQRSGCRSAAAYAQLVQLEPTLVPVQDDILQIQYRSAELKLPAGVDVDSVAALLRSLQSL